MTHPGPGVMPGLEPPAAPGAAGPQGRDERRPGGEASGKAAGIVPPREGAPVADDFAVGEDAPRGPEGAVTAEIVPGTPAVGAASAGSGVLGGAVLQPQLDEFLAVHEDELIAFRRDLH